MYEVVITIVYDASLMCIFNIRKQSLAWQTYRISQNVNELIRVVDKTYVYLNSEHYYIIPRGGPNSDWCGGFTVAEII